MQIICVAVFLIIIDHRLISSKSAKGKTYNATVLLSCEADGRSKFSLEFENGGC